jgi:hypothetical protein
MELPGLDIEEVDGEDFVLLDIPSLFYPGKPMLHENTVSCWCEPEYYETEDGEITEIVHNFPNQ